jgi:hypothetical protein
MKWEFVKILLGYFTKKFLTDSRNIDTIGAIRGDYNCTY